MAKSKRASSGGRYFAPSSGAMKVGSRQRSRSLPSSSASSKARHGVPLRRAIRKQLHKGPAHRTAKRGTKQQHKTSTHRAAKRVSGGSRRMPFKVVNPGGGDRHAFAARFRWKSENHRKMYLLQEKKEAAKRRARLERERQEEREWEEALSSCSRSERRPQRYLQLPSRRRSDSQLVHVSEEAAMDYLQNTAFSESCAQPATLWSPTNLYENYDFSEDYSGTDTDGDEEEESYDEYEDGFDEAEEKQLGRELVDMASLYELPEVIVLNDEEDDGKNKQESKQEATTNYIYVEDEERSDELAPAWRLDFEGERELEQSTQQEFLFDRVLNGRFRNDDEKQEEEEEMENKVEATGGGEVVPFVEGSGSRENQRTPHRSHQNSRKKRVSSKDRYSKKEVADPSAIMTVSWMNYTIRTFVGSSLPSLQLPAMSGEHLRMVRSLAEAYQLQETYSLAAAGEDCAPTLTKTKRSCYPSSNRLNKIISSFEDIAILNKKKLSKKKGKGGSSSTPTSKRHRSSPKSHEHRHRRATTSPSFFRNKKKSSTNERSPSHSRPAIPSRPLSVREMDGHVVGGYAPPLGINNIGNRLLRSMGWSGGALGNLLAAFLSLCLSSY
ncbi:squalene synthetase-like protein, variant 2 [Balamuthia mandrillaris]